MNDVPVSPNTSTNNEAAVSEQSVSELLPAVAQPNGHIDDDLPTLLNERRQRRGTNKWTVGLLGALLVVGGFAAGSWAQKQWGPKQSAFPFAGGLPAGFPGLGSGGGAPSLPGGTGSGSGAGSTTTPTLPAGLGNATVGTVKLIDGQNLYVTTLSGGIVKVKVAAGTSVKASRSVALSAIAPGSTVIVQGKKSADGSVAATSVSEGAALGGLGAGGGN
jgi:hypothetical protein